MVQTIRQRIITFLRRETLSARELSGLAGIPEKEVLDHLAHIARSLARGPSRLVVNPARCRRCGFVFRHRSRFTAPGRCPECRHTAISEPRFEVRGPAA